MRTTLPGDKVEAQPKQPAGESGGTHNHNVLPASAVDSNGCACSDFQLYTIWRVEVHGIDEALKGHYFTFLLLHCGVCWINALRPTHQDA